MYKQVIMSLRDKCLRIFVQFHNSDFRIYLDQFVAKCRNNEKENCVSGWNGPYCALFFGQVYCTRAGLKRCIQGDQLTRFSQDFSDFSTGKYHVWGIRSAQTKEMTGHPRCRTDKLDLNRCPTNLGVELSGSNKTTEVLKDIKQILISWKDGDSPHP